MRFKPTHFRPLEAGARRALGDLEAEIMDQMWLCECASVRDIHQRLGYRRLAYTTVMTVMSRLADKGLLKKKKDGKHYDYTTSISRAEFEDSIARSLISGLAGSLGSVALASFVEGIEDERVLCELEELIREKRKQAK
ncbi:MAG: BlaI/MecI/CopY family transcriptional regulator [Actinobacteria bacterium]|nr:BlaI/MecI/CopY family transcriptional regulator [Actinomycetota bacterium]